MTVDDGHQQALKCCSVGRDIVIKRYYDDLKDLLLAIIASSGNLFVFLLGENLYGDYRKVVHQQSKLISQMHFSTILIFIYCRCKPIGSYLFGLIDLVTNPGDRKENQGLQHGTIIKSMVDNGNY
jgi:hypothetical protein